MYFEHKELLDPPIKRAAYSDRTSWLMAEMARVTYIKFEVTDDALFNKLVDDLANINDKQLIERKIKYFLESQNEIDVEGQKKLIDALGEASFDLVRTFNNNGTQALLAKREMDKIAILAFRGTEKEDIRDIKTDLNARFYKDDNGAKIHTGFYKAFKGVEKDIREELKKLTDYSLYITGHSLGGALALIATREINSDNLAACYTFGSPKVGNSEFGDPIKAPIYRVVNAVDIVPCLPDTYIIEILYLLINLVLRMGISLRVPLLTDLLKFIQKTLQNYKEYEHQGDMRFLTTCAADFKDLRLIPNYNEIYRTVRVLKNFFVSVNDHSIEKYCEKLGNYAINRNA